MVLPFRTSYLKQIVKTSRRTSQPRGFKRNLQPMMAITSVGLYANIGKCKFSQPMLFPARISVEPNSNRHCLSNQNPD